jgi:PAS domain S-box-containing protein
MRAVLSRFPSRLSLLDRVALLYGAVYFVCLAARAEGVPVPIVLDVAFYPLGLVVGWANWRNSTASGLDRRTRLAWRLLAIASAILWVSGSVWSVWIEIFGRSAVADLVDRAGVLQYVLTIVAYLCLPGLPVPPKGVRRFVLDAAFLVVAGSAIAFYMGLKIERHFPPGRGTLLIVESWLDWALFIVAAVGCMQKREPVIRRAVVLLLAANLSSLIGNHVMALTPTYHSGDPVDGFWFAAWALRWTAARYTWHHYATAGADPAPEEPKALEYRGNPFAYVLVGGAFALLVTQILARDQELLPMLAVAAMAMSGLLILRQFVELQENRRLVRSQIERESRFTSLVSRSSDVVLLIDGQGVVTYISPSVTRVFGPDVRVAPGSQVKDLLAPDDAEALASALAGAPSGAPRFESRVQVAPGRWREVEAVWKDLRQDPAVNGIVVNCRDVTDRNEIERHLQHAQKLDAMGHLAGGLAHDLNNVLAVVRGYSELLQSDLGEGSPAAADLEQIMKAVDRATSVTQKVLAFSRKQPGRRTLLDLNDVVRDLRPMLGHLVKDQVDVRLALAPGLWPIRADQGQLEQVLVNLATNARDAMPNGGALDISTANRTVAGDPGDPRSLPAGDYVSIAVRDEGTGIPAALLPRLFEPFFTTKPQDRGLGLGLAIVHGIVSDLDGRVVVDSVEGRGSTFTIFVPRAPAGAQPA